MNSITLKFGVIVFGIVMWHFTGSRDAYTFEKLRGKSDVILIATLQESRVIPNRTKNPDVYKKIESTFCVRTMLKGTVPGKTIRIEHFRPKRDGGGKLDKGLVLPDLVSKDLDRLQELEKADHTSQTEFYLLFASHSGRESVYVPASGDHGQFSLYEVVGPIDE